jgi:hypothetical protein
MISHRVLLCILLGCRLTQIMPRPPTMTSQACCCKKSATGRSPEVLQRALQQLISLFRRFTHVHLWMNHPSSHSWTHRQFLPAGGSLALGERQLRDRQDASSLPCSCCAPLRASSHRRLAARASWRHSRHYTTAPLWSSPLPTVSGCMGRPI